MDVSQYFCRFKPCVVPLTFACAISLSGCGGSGSHSSTSEPQVPAVNTAPTIVLDSEYRVSDRKTHNFTFDSGLDWSSNR